MKNNDNILQEEIGKELPFSIPTNYFDQFAIQMDRQIGYRNSYHRILKHWMYMAALFAGIFIIGGFFYSENQRNIARNTENYEGYVLSQVDETALMDYYVDGTTK
jgi:hypothetical protein